MTEASLRQDFKSHRIKEDAIRELLRLEALIKNEQTGIDADEWEAMDSLIKAMISLTNPLSPLMDYMLCLEKGTYRRACRIKQVGLGWREEAQGAGEAATGGKRFL